MDNGQWTDRLFAATHSYESSSINNNNNNYKEHKLLLEIRVGTLVSVGSLVGKLVLQESYSNQN
jgi:hypothetical protein